MLDSSALGRFRSVADWQQPARSGQPSHDLTTIAKMRDIAQMNGLNYGEAVVKVGVYLYDGTVECDLRIIRTAVCYGSGDYEDSADIADDQQCETFYVQYGSTTERGKFNARSGAFLTVDDAIAAVEKIPGVGNSGRWRTAI
jgi:hypothetical protein